MILHFVSHTFKRLSTPSTVSRDFISFVSLWDTRVFPFCQKSKIEKVIPLRFWIRWNYFQTVQRLENLYIPKGASPHFYVYEANLFNRIFRYLCFYLKNQTYIWDKPRKSYYREIQNCKKIGSKFWNQGDFLETICFIHIKVGRGTL